MENSEAKVIKESVFGGWTMYQIGDIYAFLEQETGQWGTTPNGNRLTTRYFDLAEKLLDDLDSFGPDYFGSNSSLPWHYTMIDNFSQLPHAEVEQILEDSFLEKQDWSLSNVVEQNEKLKETFGVKKGKKEQIREWLKRCTHMQMTAACCVGNAYHSLNLSFILADYLEKYEGEELREKRSELANIVALLTQDVPFDVLETFYLFELYYGIHLKENGKNISK